MPRKNVGFFKPPEPSFITRMKQEIGYKDGPSVDTKRERLAAATMDDLDDRGDDEAPTVVVLREGDLTAEEVEREKAKSTPQDKEDTNAKESAGRIIFRKPTKRDASSEVASGSAVNSAESSSKRSRSDKHKSKPKQNTKLLSFQHDDEEEED